jgi:hypothetical protein
MKISNQLLRKELARMYNEVRFKVLYLNDLEYYFKKLFPEGL